MDMRKIAAFLMIGATAVACGEDANKDGLDIDHQTASQAISSNSRAMAERVVNGLDAIDESQLLTDAIGLIGEGETVCAGGVDGSGAEFDTGECESTSFELDPVEIDDGAEELIGELERRIFSAENIETQSSKAITYLLRGDVVCADGVDVDQECADIVDALEVRIYASSPDDGDIDLALQFGAERHTPVLIEIHQDRLAAEVDLGDVKATVNHYAAVTGEDIEMPDTMRGRVRAELLAGSDTIAAQVSIVQAVLVSDEDIEVALGAAVPAARVAINPAAREVEALVDLDSIHARFPDTSYSYNTETGEETETRHLYELFVAGVSAATTLSVDADTLTVTEISLGDETSTLQIDGEQVIGVDLNAAANRVLSATIGSIDDGVDITVDPEFDLSISMNMAAAGLAFEDVEPWMMDDTLSIVLDGAAQPRVLIGDDGLQVVDGSLSIELENAGSSISASAGQCLSGEIDDAPSVDGTTESTSYEDPVSALELVACN